MSTFRKGVLSSIHQRPSRFVTLSHVLQVIFRPLKMQHYSDNIELFVGNASFLMPVHAYTPLTHIEVGRWAVGCCFGGSVVVVVGMWGIEGGGWARRR